ARGGEAVILVENIRSYYDILLRNAPPFGPTPKTAESLKRLVQEVEERRKSYTRRMAAAKVIGEPDDDTENRPPRLPTINASASN
ncbi:MAG: hypothetical protein JNL16_07880, partial [Dechloromonas sp.]|nr:hypothetical protein [Dechloromonas sp.]